MSDSNGAANPCDTSKPAVGMYSYDPNGLRVKATINGSTYDYVYDLAGHQIGQWDATNGRTRGELYVGSMHLATFTPTETYFLHTDQVGTLRALTTHDGTVASKCPSSPFGDGFNCNIPSKTLFTDYERDGETGLDHSWFRQYSPRAGRYHSPDPVLGTPEDPQSWNRYAYVRGNPVNLIDPLGLRPECYALVTWFVNDRGSIDGYRVDATWCIEDPLVGRERGDAGDQSSSGGSTDDRIVKITPEQAHRFCVSQANAEFVKASAATPPSFAEYAQNVFGLNFRTVSVTAGKAGIDQLQKKLTPDSFKQSYSISVLLNATWELGKGIVQSATGGVGCTPAI